MVTRVSPVTICQHQNYQIVFLVMRTFKIYFLSAFEICYAVFDCSHHAVHYITSWWRLFYLFRLCCMALGILVPSPGTEPWTHGSESHCTVREFPSMTFILTGSLYFLIPFTHFVHLSKLPPFCQPPICSLYLWVCFVCPFGLFFRFHI